MKTLLIAITFVLMLVSSNAFSSDDVITTCQGNTTMTLNIIDNKFNIVATITDSNGKKISKELLSGTVFSDSVEAKDEDIKIYQDSLTKAQLINTKLVSGQSLLIESSKDYERYFYHLMVDDKDNLHAFIIPVSNPRLTYLGSVDACKN